MNFEKYFVFLSLGDALASADKKKSEIGSKESILILLCFRPDTIYDSARGLYWNLSENRVKYILSLTDKKGNNAKIKKYVLSLRPKIGWDGEGSINHIELLKNIFDSEIGISKENFINLMSDENLNKCLDVINNDFCRLFSKDRHLLMTKCLTLRFAEIKQFIK